ncbi:MAG: peptide deformylase [Saprospiraceae bacterium]|nr:peptide deformylase [Saprospiraceae bacterium]
MAKLFDILLLGDERLYQRSEVVQEHEIPAIHSYIDILSDLVLAFRAKYGKGRAIAAPQIGVFKRIIVMNIDRPIAIINPELEFPDEEIITLWDDCMSFPHLLVKVNRYRRCKLRYKDLTWMDQHWDLQDDLSELIQHEYDHLEGILATQRAIDNKSFQFINV